MATSTCFFEFEELEVNGKLYNVQGEAFGKWVNMGIGPYEFCGRKGNDISYGIEGFEIPVSDFDAWEVNEDGETEVHENALKEEIIDKIFETKAEQIIELLEKDRGRE